jgi:alkylation response protein AidB-like acyl-CoA dehydrogenase
MTKTLLRDHTEPSGMSQADYETFRDELFVRIWHDLDPLEREIEDNEELPLDKLIPLLTEMKAFGLLIPAEYGGVGLSIPQYIPVLAEFAKIQGGIRVLVHVHNTMAHMVWEFGSEEQRRELLPDVATCRRSVAFGLTEPDYGTGAGMGTSANLVGDVYRLNGRKWLITNSNVATDFIVFAKTIVDGENTGISAFLAERDSAGFEIQPLPETMGCKGGEHGLLTFRDVEVQQDSVLGAHGRGLEQMEQALEISRLLIAATSLGTAERALELSLEFSKQRVTFGKPIAERQAIQRYLAEMATDIYALRQMIRDAAQRWDQGFRIPTEASMCKLFGLEAVGRVTDRALLVHGGIGYTRHHAIERLYRDARLNWLEEGTPSIQQMVIARQFLGGYEWTDRVGPTDH